MKYVIYGMNRVSKDFLYIFDWLDVVWFVEDNDKKELLLSYDIVSLKETIIRKNEFDKMIVCDFDKSEKVKKLDAAGLKYGEDYVFEEDFFIQLDEVKIPSDKKIVIWGTGKNAKQLLGMKMALSVDCYIDNNEEIREFNGCKVIHPSTICNWDDYFIIISVTKDSEIKNQLKGYGLYENKDYITYKKFVSRPSEMLRKTIFDRSYYDLECNTMLNHLEILPEGNTRCCCTTFVSQDLDNIFEKNKDDLWHSNLHKVMCLSTENKTFSFCDKSMCPLFVDKQVSFDDCYSEKKYKEISEYPKVLALGYDPSCNLRCSTCRKEVHFAKAEELENVNAITKKIEDDYLADCEFLILAGNGEVFAANSYKKIYESVKCKPDYIRLLSNGTLFTKERWEHFKKDKHGKIMLTVSIDAATKETYEQKIRCGGNFGQLKKNMKFASELRKKGELCYLRMNFVVQRNNYKEMIPFVQWGEELGVDEIFFTKILNWGTYTEEEFENVSMMEKDGITPKKELLEVLSDTYIKDSKIVDLGTIRYGHKMDQVDVVENYYMWELEKRGGHLFD